MPRQERNFVPTNVEMQERLEQAAPAIIRAARVRPQPHEQSESLFSLGVMLLRKFEGVEVGVRNVDTGETSGSPSDENLGT